MDLRPIFFVIGIFLVILAASMSIPLLVDLYFNNPDWKVFFLCIICTGFFGGALILSNSAPIESFTIRQAFLLITMSWLFMCFFAALPLWMSELDLSFTDAFFEAVSGLTTTGSTVIVGLDTSPPGILLWRALLQWLGGIGVVLMAMSVMPFLNIGGMQLFETELSEQEKALPRFASLIQNITIIYVGLTVACAVSYGIAGMGSFDAIAHALTTISTGGFSTYDTSFSHYHSYREEMVCVIFMLLGGLPFILYLKTLHGDWQALLRDSQVRTFFFILVTAITLITFYLVAHLHMELGAALETTVFNTVSLITGTGFSNGGYGAWGGFAVTLLFFLMVMGACAGSTTCGIKIFRFQIIYEITVVQLKQLLYPNGIFIPHYKGKAITNQVAISVMGFFFLYALAFSIIAILLSFFNLDFLTAMSASATAISNVGPGLGDIIGPVGNFKPLVDPAKWILCAGMLLGRLELFTVLILFSPSFWKK